MKLILIISLVFIICLINVRAEEAPFKSIPCPHPDNLGFVCEIKVGTEVIKIPFAIFLPKCYETDKTRRFPMILYLIGVGNQGSDLNGEHGIFEHGPCGATSNAPTMLKYLPIIICSPQTMRGWDATMIKAVASLVKMLPSSFRIDTDRIIVSGLSMGGTGTWTALAEGHEIYAAAAPMCARPWGEPDQLANKLHDITIWNIVGGADDGAFVNGAKNMNAALLNAGADSQLTVVPNIGHWVWMSYYGNPEFYHWIMRQIRPTDDMTTQAVAFRKLQNNDNSLIIETNKKTPNLK